MTRITTDSVKALYDGDKSNPLYKDPIVQLIEITPFQTQVGTRYRLSISDGTHSMEGMIYHQKESLIENGDIKVNSIVKLTNFIWNTNQFKNTLVIFALEVVQKDVAQVVGNPTSLGGASDTKPGKFTKTANLKSYFNANGKNPEIQSTSKPTIQSNNQATSKPAFQSSNQSPSKSATSNFKKSASASNFKKFTPGGKKPTSGASYSKTPVLISSLTVGQTGWILKVRLIKKSDIKKWNNAKGDGQLFSCEFRDASGDIKATIFQDQVDRLYSVLEEEKEYTITNARVTEANKKYSGLGQTVELQFDRNTEITEALEVSDEPENEEDEGVSEFTRIGDFVNREKGDKIDFLAVVTKDHGLSVFNSKDNKPLKKRDVDIVDKSLKTTRVTIWGSEAEKLDITENCILACKDAIVNVYKSKLLNVNYTSIIEANPDHPEAFKLHSWYVSEGHKLKFEPLGGEWAAPVTPLVTKKMSISDALSQGLGTHGKDEYASVKGTVFFVKAENAYYLACDTCKKKVTRQKNGWKCDKCDEVLAEPVYNYTLNVGIKDEESQIYVQVFGVAGETITNMTAKEFSNLGVRGKNGVKDAIDEMKNKTYDFKIKAFQTTYNGTKYTRYSCVEVTPIA